MKKAASTLLALVLSVSMAFVAAPMAFADELLPPQPEPLVEIVSQESNSTPEALNAEVPVDEATIDSNELSASDEDVNDTSTLTALEGTSSDEGLVLESSADDLQVSMLALENTDTLSSLDKLKALYELGLALEELYNTVKYAHGPSIVCVNQGCLETVLINEFETTAQFQEGTYYSGLVRLVNSINELLILCDLPAGLSVTSLPISVIGELPEGFVFENNQLELVDRELLKWNKELDAQEALVRSYEVALQLNTGNKYIDGWLQKKGYNGIASAEFIIDLELIELPDGGFVPPGPPDPTDPPDPTEPGNPEEPSPPDPIVNDPQPQMLTVVPEDTTASDPVVPAEPTEPDTTPTPEEPESVLVDTTRTLEGQEIPMASMMVNDQGNSLAVNSILVTLSLALSVLALASLRQTGQLKVPQAGAENGGLKRTSFAMGIAGVGFGAISATAFVISQYFVSDTFASSVSWTPVLATLSFAQVACLITLLTSNRLEEKRRDPRRFKVRY